MSFELLNLNSNISKAISICGYTSPTPIQSRSIPEILGGRDLVASARTGTGKTAAFVLPALDRVSTASASTSTGKPRVLILTPTRELATQITDAVSRYGKFLKVNIVSLLGGMPYHKQLKALSRPVDIIIATPGRLMDHMERGRVNLSNVEMLILDEADRMLDMGFIDDVNLIAKKTPSNRQTLLFSATVDNKLAHVVRNLLKDPVRIDLSTEQLTPTTIKQELYFADSPHHKMRLLQHLIANENIYKAIIFSATKVNADRLAQELCDQDFAAAPLHGDLKQNQRNKTIEQLRRGNIQFLVATDVAARGIDVSDITHVINYDLPRFSEDYVHRIGRTGRAGKEGIAISFALPTDSRHLQQIERFIGKKITTSVIPGLEPTKRQKSASDGGKSNGYGHSKSGGGYGRKKSADGGSSSGGYGRKKSSDGDSSGYGRKKSGEGKSFSGGFGRKKSAEGDSFSGGYGRKKSAEGDSFSGGYGRKKSAEGDSFSGGYGRKKSADGDSFSGGYGRKKSADGDSFSGGYGRKKSADGDSFSGGYGRKKSSDGDSFSGGYGRKKSSDGDSFSGGYGRKKSADGDSSFGARKKSADSGSFSGGYARKKSADGDSFGGGFARKKSADGSPSSGFGRKKSADGDSFSGGYARKRSADGAPSTGFGRKKSSEGDSFAGGYARKKTADGANSSGFDRKRSPSKSATFRDDRRSDKPASFKPGSKFKSKSHARD